MNRRGVDPEPESGIHILEIYLGKSGNFKARDYVESLGMKILEWHQNPYEFPPKMVIQVEKVIPDLPKNIYILENWPEYVEEDKIRSRAFVADLQRMAIETKAKKRGI